jgi:hypothetical protein
VPPQDRPGSHRKHHRPKTARNKLGQSCEPNAVSRLVPRTRDLTAKHSVLMTENQQLNILGHITTDEHRHQREQESNDHVSRDASREDPSRSAHPQENYQVKNISRVFERHRVAACRSIRTPRVLSRIGPLTRSLMARRMTLRPYAW